MNPEEDVDEKNRLKMLIRSVFPISRQR
jgi:hypothetical protein